MSRSVVLALLVGMLLGCGQAGPLYFRDEPPDSQLSPSQRKARAALPSAETAAAVQPAETPEAIDQQAATTAVSARDVPPADAEVVPVEREESTAAPAAGQP